MLVYNSDAPSARPSEVISPEITNFSEKEKKIVENDLQLQIISKDLAKKEELIRLMRLNPQIFEATDAPASRSNYLKGLGYGQIASNGESFDEFLKKHGNKAIDEAIAKRDSGEWTGKDYREFVKYQDSIDIKANLSLDATNEGKRKAAIENTERMRKLAEYVKIAQDSLNPEGKNLVQSQVNKIKSDSRTLETLGIPQGEVNDPKYEILLQASALRGLGQDASFIERYVDTAKQKTFRDSLDEIGKLGIVGYEVNVKSISAHIDSRFPRGESTERAKAEITRSIESGTIASIYYDGRGEKYTLIDRDGRTTKEVYIDPPRVSVRQSTLSHEFPVYTSTEITERAGDRSRLQALKTRNEGLPLEFLSSLTTGEYKEKKMEVLKGVDPSLFERFRGDLDTLYRKESPRGEKRESAERMSVTLRSIRTEPVGLYDQEMALLDQFLRDTKNEEQLEKGLEKVSPHSDTPAKMEMIVRSNLSLLIEKGFHDMGKDATRALKRMIEYDNKSRSEANSISLEKRLESHEVSRLETYLEKLGITKENRKREGLIDIQRNISTLLNTEGDAFEKRLSENETNKSELS